MTTATYTPRAGSVADRALTFLNENGQTSEAELAEACDCDNNDIRASLNLAIQHGAVTRQRVNGIWIYRFLNQTQPAIEDSAERVACFDDPVIPKFLPSSAEPSDKCNAAAASDAADRLLDQAFEIATGAAPPQRTRFAIWCDGSLQIEREGQQSLILDGSEFKALRKFVDRMSEAA